MAIVDTPLAGKADAESLLLYRKITWKLIPFLCLCYLAAYLDRINVGLAAADGRRAAAERSGLRPGRRAVLRRLYSVRGAEQPDPAARRRQNVDRPHHDHLGLLSTATMFVTTPTQFYVIRFLLGVAEAGFLPGVLFYLTLWFPTYRRGRIIALFMIGLPLSSVIGGPLSGWIMGHFDMRHGLHGWQWLFCWRAFPACCWAAC